MCGWIKERKGCGKASRRVQDWKVHAGVYKGVILYHSPHPQGPRKSLAVGGWVLDAVRKAIRTRDVRCKVRWADMEELRSRRSRRTVVSKSCTQIRPCLFQSTFSTYTFQDINHCVSWTGEQLGPILTFHFRVGSSTSPSSRYKANGTLEGTDQRWAQMLPTHLYCCICILLHIYYWIINDLSQEDILCFTNLS